MNNNLKGMKLYNGTLAGLPARCAWQLHGYYDSFFLLCFCAQSSMPSSRQWSATDHLMHRTNRHVTATSLWYVYTIYPHLPNCKYSLLPIASHSPGLQHTELWGTGVTAQQHKHAPHRHTSHCCVSLFIAICPSMGMCDCFLCNALLSLHEAGELDRRAAGGRTGGETERGAYIQG